MTREKETANPSLTPREAIIKLEAFCDGEIMELEEESVAVEAWPTQVQPGTNRRRSQELQNIVRLINKIEHFRLYIRTLIEDLHPELKNQTQ